MIIRTFIAIPISPSKDFLFKVQQIRRELVHENFRWVDPLNWHITLCFIGNIEQGIAIEIGRELRNQLAGIKEERLYFNHINYYRRSGLPVVLWAGIKEENWVREAYRRVITVIDENAPIQKSGHFRPHLTIARMKKVKNQQKFLEVIDRMKAFELGSAFANEITLYSSQLTPKGPIYNKLEAINLRE